METIDRVPFAPAPPTQVSTREAALSMRVTPAALVPLPDRGR
jgi:hypothetical protein